jgi:stage IV sporulation protein FB
MEFRLGPFPIKIHLSFFITTVLLSGAWRNPVVIAEWSGVVLVSVLLHELGHAAMGRAFGLTPRIDLHGMGGTTSWTAARGRLTAAKSVLISVAGPGVGIFVGGLVFAAARAGLLPPNDVVADVAAMMVQVNVGWGFVNLLPILPMDGGNVLFAILNGATKGRGERPTRYVSIVVAVVVGLAWFVLGNGWWLPMLAGLFAYENVRALRALGAAEAAVAVPR